MKRAALITAACIAALSFSSCKKQSAADMPAAAMTAAELTELANKVPSSGPREGNNYKLYVLVLRQNQAAAVNFKVDAFVKGKSEAVTVRTNERGLAQFDNLPFPSMKNQLIATVHYYKGADDQPREIAYPYIEGDAYRLKDVQYIPNTVTPDPAP